MKRLFWTRQRLDFVNGISFAIGFTGQVKKIWHRHIFFIFDGVREWILGLVWKLQVGGGLVQCSNQGQIDCTCLRFRDLSGNCRHTHTVTDTCRHARTHTQMPTHDYSLTHIRSHTNTCLSSYRHLYQYIHTHAKQREAFHTTSMCKPRSSLLEGKLNTLNWKCKGVSGSMVPYKAGAGHTRCRGACTIKTGAHIQIHSQNSWCWSLIRFSSGVMVIFSLSLDQTNNPRSVCLFLEMSCIWAQG